jgi:hypothetical protein
VRKIAVSLYLRGVEDKGCRGDGQAGQRGVANQQQTLLRLQLQPQKAQRERSDYHAVYVINAA